MKIKKEKLEDIIKSLQNRFPTFGGSKRDNDFNPLSIALENKPAMFAMGVDIKDVVKFILGELPK